MKFSPAAATRITFILRWAIFLVLLRFGNGQGTLNAAIPLTADEQRQIVSEHNQLRGIPRASNMQQLVFDSNLASSAQQWANQCNAAESPLRNRVVKSGYDFIGENVAYGGPLQNLPDLRAIVDTWFQEGRNYQYGPIGAAGSCSTCSHYTQVVWSNSCAVGCAAASCDKLANTNFTTGWIVVCHYGPGGNIMGESPYKEGTPCQTCAGQCTEFGICPNRCQTNSATVAPLPTPQSPSPQPVGTNSAVVGGGNTAGPPTCVDRVTDCPARVQKGQCKSNEAFMFINCRLSCGCPAQSGNLPADISSALGGSNLHFVQPGAPVLNKISADPSCIDGHPLCPYWTSIGECAGQNANWMSSTCPGSCRTQCAASKINPPPVCQDLDDTCADWASHNECVSNAYYMQWRCRKSCELC